MARPIRLPERLSASPLYAFFAKGVVLLVALTVLWAPVADWTMRPAAAAAYTILKAAFPWWVRSGEYKDNSFELETRIEVPAPNAPPGTVAILVAEAKPSHYGFGLPMLLALMIAAGSRRMLRNLFLGILCLIPFQTFSIAFDLLNQVAVTGGVAAAAQTGFSAATINGIALCYQLGVLLLPALSPIVIWLILERPFLTALIIDGQLRRQQDIKAPGAEP